VTSSLLIFSFLSSALQIGAGTAEALKWDARLFAKNTDYLEVTIDAREYTNALRDWTVITDIKVSVIFADRNGRQIGTATYEFLPPGDQLKPGVHRQYFRHTQKGATAAAGETMSFTVHRVGTRYTGDDQPVIRDRHGDAKSTPLSLDPSLAIVLHGSVPPSTEGATRDTTARPNYVQRTKSLSSADIEFIDKSFEERIDVMRWLNELATARRFVHQVIPVGRRHAVFVVVSEPDRRDVPSLIDFMKSADRRSGPGTTPESFATVKATLDFEFVGALEWDDVMSLVVWYERP
jgi:hypothetical protein